MNRTLLAATIAGCFAGSASADTVKTAYFACKSQETFEQGNDIRRSGDAEAFQKFLLASLTSGQCIALSVGMKVFWQGAPKSSLVKFRPEGQVESYITYSNAVVD